MPTFRHLELVFMAFASAGLLGGAREACAQTASDLSQLSLEELGDVQVTSVSKRAQSLSEAPSAIFVISHDDIAQSAATSIPEALRLAPNLRVAQTSASRYVITARGFNGSPAAQNYSNKLLVLIDGRTVYSPLFSGVYWDTNDVVLQDVDRIEVISGPGATLWGANAVNGVINIITRRAAETQGGLVAVTAGDEERSLTLRYGGKLGDEVSWRVYAKSFRVDSADLASGGSAGDHWRKPQGGFRLDWAPSASDSITLQGDAYKGYEGQASAAAEDVNGRNLTARWNRTSESGAALQVQAFYDRAKRSAPADGSGFRADTYDLDLQHSFKLGERHEIVWGGGYRAVRYRIDSSSSLRWEPARRTLKQANAFVQDSVALAPNLGLVVGVKVEDDPYVKAEVLPNARLSFQPNDRLSLWAAASRAIRSPTPFDRDVVELIGTMRFLVAGDRFRSEELTAYEVGAKAEVSPRTQVSVAAYYNDYDDLRSIEFTPVTLLPLRWGNLMRGRTWGVEAWADHQMASWWKLSGSVNFLEEEFDFKPGSSLILGTSQVANDPKYQATLSSSMNLPGDLALDATLRYVSALPDPRTASYTELNARLAWNVTEKVQLSLAGRNLLHDRHVEYVQGEGIPRSLFVDLQWRF